MCTLAVALRARPDTPLAIAANRDELYARPALPPRLEPGALPALMPIDLQEGGTWLGLNARGLFVGITNRAGGGRAPDRRSRGLLVRDALTEQSAAALHRRLGALDPRLYNGFHLVYADAGTAFVTWSDGARLTQLSLPPGVHVFTERSFGAGPSEREPLLAARLAQHLASGRPTPASLRAQASFHGPEGAPLDGACVHGEAFGYGTRSSFQLVLDADGSPSALWTEGPPCTSPAVDLTPTVRSLFGRA
jgi:hypothetical protein